MLDTMSPPWDDDQHKGQAEGGPDAGEGSSLTAHFALASDAYRNKSTCIHECIMIQYSLISFVRMQFGLSDFAEDVINTLSVTVDDLDYMRNNLERR